MNTKVTLAGFDCSRCFSHNNSADRIKEEEKTIENKYKWKGPLMNAFLTLLE
ncbi:hypothetical protein ACFY5J_20455 [Peribacillus butanolivorans]|uniref:hypothetical protein n=1 Tax=Peribacillus butanolivorans TaxID=421767 RepID=UPI0036C48B84